jgi:hypothetical protein
MAQGVATNFSRPAFQTQQTTGEDLSGKEGYVVFQTSGTISLVDGASDDRGAFNGYGGILSSVTSSATGSNCEVLVGRVWAIAGAAITAGDRLTSATTDARLIKAASSADNIIAFAITGAGAAGDWVLIDWVGNTTAIA